MAAVTPDATDTFVWGNHTVLRASFTSTTFDDADTYASGVSGVKFYLFQQTDNPTTQASAGVSIAESSGTFTFYPGENGATGHLLIFH